MSFTIDKSTVTAGSRALKAEWSTEIAQDLNAIHGIDAEKELAGICLLYTSPSPRDRQKSRMPSSA